MPVIRPVIVPVQHEKKCIVVKGKKYCEDADMTKQDFAGFGFILVFLIVWLLMVGEGVVNERHEIYVIIVGLAPFWLTALVCLIYGLS
jgi:hypothetical protein